MKKELRIEGIWTKTDAFWTKMVEEKPTIQSERFQYLLSTGISIHFKTAVNCAF
jgi:hypothetical protein